MHYCAPEYKVDFHLVKDDSRWSRSPKFNLKQKGNFVSECCPKYTSNYNWIKHSYKKLEEDCIKL